MRDIKFRGKRVDNGEWVYGHYFQSPLTEENALNNDVDDGLFFLSGYTQYCIESDHVVFIVGPETIGEYTGLHDKNGKEIYEEDIFMFCGIPHMVEYYETVAGYVGWPRERRKYGCALITNENIEIIGNIHENPELLEQ